MAGNERTSTNSTCAAEGARRWTRLRAAQEGGGPAVALRWPGSGGFYEGNIQLGMHSFEKQKNSILLRVGRKGNRDFLGGGGAPCVNKLRCHAGDQTAGAEKAGVGLQVHPCPAVWARPRRARMRQGRDTWRGCSTRSAPRETSAPSRNPRFPIRTVG